MTRALTPPLKWHGGKHYLTARVIGLMPPHLHYVEPYFGGGQVLFARDPADRRLWWPHPQSDGRVSGGVSEVANDLNGNVIAFYRVLRDPDQFERLRLRLELTPVSEAEWEHARDLVEGGGDADPVERAAAVFVFCRQSLSGRMKGFAVPTVTRLRGGRQEAVNAWLGAVEGLDAVHCRLRDVMFLDRPAVEVIRQQDAPSTLFYCDPPYHPDARTAKKVYRYEMTDADHADLLDLLRSVKGQVILSGLANPLYDVRLADWNRHTKELPNNASGAKTKRRMTEVLWCNF